LRIRSRRKQGSGVLLTTYSNEEEGDRRGVDKRGTYRVSVGILRERDHLEVLGID
jgi:hypothetical protein